MRELIIVAAICALPLSALAQTPCVDWSCSPDNWQNSQQNWENSPQNWRNDPNNWDNSPYNLDSRGVYDGNGDQHGYIMHEPGGPTNFYDSNGDLSGYSPDR